MTPKESDSREPLVRKYDLIAGRMHATQLQETSREQVTDAVLRSNLLSVLRKTAGFEQERKGEQGPRVWIFGNLIEREIQGKSVLFARLGKLRPGFEQNMFDWRSRGFVSAPVDMQTATGYSNFVIDIETRTILFEVRPPAISEKQFVTYFRRLYESHTKGFQTIDISRISPTKEIYDFILGLDRLMSIAADVQPSNPETTQEFRELQKALEKTKADRAVIKLYNDSVGLSTDNTLASQAVALAAAGYGRVVLQGVKEGKSLRLESTSKVVTETIPRMPDVPEELIEPFWRRLRAMLEKLGKR